MLNTKELASIFLPYIIILMRKMKCIEPSLTPWLMSTDPSSFLSQLICKGGTVILSLCVNTPNIFLKLVKKSLQRSLSSDNARIIFTIIIHAASISVLQ